MGEKRGIYKISGVEPEGKGYLGDPCKDERIILRWIIRKWCVGA
jgi:hypothetical protein